MHNRTSEPPARSPRRRSVALAVAALTAVALAALTPWPRGFQGAPTGDAELMAEVEQALGGKHWQHIAAARVDGDEVAFAGTGADEHTEFEIGSITKTFTAALFADAIDRGEIDADTRLGEVWPDLEGKVAEVSLESIAMQRSGLPAQKPWSGFAEGLTSILANYVRADPYRASPSDVVAGLDSVELGDREPEYSNFGFAVLGQALAEVTGHDYAELVRTRITEPLGMKDDTFVPGSPEGLSHGFTASGLPAAPWVMGGSRPGRCDPLEHP
jgi:CubicO group peptidase (beta-lactamase class C family)